MGQRSAERCLTEGDPSSYTNISTISSIYTVYTTIYTFFTIYSIYTTISVPHTPAVVLSERFCCDFTEVSASGDQLTDTCARALPWMCLLSAHPGWHVCIICLGN